MAAISTIRPLQLQTCRGQEVEQEQSFLAKIFLKDQEKQPEWWRAAEGGELSPSETLNLGIKNVNFNCYK